MRTIKWKNNPCSWNGERGRFTDFLATWYPPAHDGVMGAEIGVLNGDHVLEFFNRPFVPIKYLYLIDPYSDYPEYCDQNRSGLEAARDKAIAVLGSLHTWNCMCEEETFQWLFSKSSIAIDVITDLLDFVYIDGNHRKKYVYNDLWDYVDIVKTGGIIGGHDYYHRDDPTNLCGVKGRCRRVPQTNGLHVVPGRDVRGRLARLVVHKRRGHDPQVGGDKEKGKMKEILEKVKEKIYEPLAAIEHERWADWQKYLHSKGTTNEYGDLVLSKEDVAHWQYQIDTSYRFLSEREKIEDRKQVDRYYPLLEKTFTDIIDSVGRMVEDA